MARQAKAALIDVVEYVPNIENNRQDPDPFVVGLEPMTGDELKAFERVMGEMSGGKINFTERAQKLVENIFAKRVKWAKNYSIPHKRTKERLEPKNGAGLYRAIVENGDELECSIIDDIVEALKNHSHLRTGLLETLRSQSEPPPSATNP
jgi:hypothetical protein